jgi:EAL domain-containing protein (putative c-di-GMP-specific phosphodiesterase class I)
MSVTAEGVERPEERDLLVALECDVAQGYLISRPLAPDAVRRYLEAAAADAEHALAV